MCGPVAAMWAFTIASTAYSVYSVQRNAKKQEAAIAEAEAARAGQIADQKSAEMNERRRRARMERARLRAASAETGLSGFSVADMLNDVTQSASLDLATIRNNAGNALDANRVEADSRRASIQQPDYLGAALQIGAGTFNNGGWGWDENGLYIGAGHGKG